MRTHQLRLIIGVTALTVLGAVSAGAQEGQRSNARWQAWYGCWRAEPRDSAGTQTAPRTVCLTPTSNPDVVEVVALAQGRIVHRDTVDASGVLREVSADDCKGSQSARWSADGRRVFLTALTTCTGAVTKTTSVLSMTAFGEWIDVRSVVAPGASVVNVARYRDVGFAPDTPGEIVEAVRGYRLNADAARIATSAPISASAVVEASKVLDKHALAAWVAQPSLRFQTNAASLSELADAGVSAEVTDAMVTAEANSRDSYDPYVGKFGPQASDYWDQGTGMRVWYTETDPWSYGFGNAWRYGRSYQRYAFGTSNPWRWTQAMGFNDAFSDPFSSLSASSSTPVGSILPPTIVLHNDPTNTSARGRAGKADNADNSNDAPAKGIVGKVIDKVTGTSSSSSSSGSKPAPSGKP